MGKKLAVKELKGKRDVELAELIDKGLLLDRRKKRAESDLKKVKEAINKKVKGKEGRWLTPNMGYLCISKREQFGEIDPVEAFTFLKSKRRGRDFFGCIKVMFEQFKSYADEDDLKRLRPCTGDSLTFSFKKETK